VWCIIGSYFWIVNYFWKLPKKLDKVNNSHEYLAYKSWVIWSQNTKVMAQKQISIQSVMQNSTSVSCNYPKEPTCYNWVLLNIISSLMIHHKHPFCTFCKSKFVEREKTLWILLLFWLSKRMLTNVSQNWTWHHNRGTLIQSLKEFCSKSWAIWGDANFSHEEW